MYLLCLPGAVKQMSSAIALPSPYPFKLLLADGLNSRRMVALLTAEQGDGFLPDSAGVSQYESDIRPARQQHEALLFALGG
jgi:hypothetical protein